MGEETTIQAELNSIRYQNGNGFIIGNFSVSKKGFSGLGEMLNPQPGLEYKLTGRWETHATFGKQFKFTRYIPQKPADEDGIYTYLVRVCKWVGPSIAEDLLDGFGDDTLQVLKDDPLKVARAIKGITLKKAKSIQKQLVENEELEAALVELMGLLNIPGLRKSLPMQLIDKYKSDAVDALKENPYIICDFDGTGFMVADRLALSEKFKIDPKSVFRIRAAVNHALKEGLRATGSTWIQRVVLLEAVRSLISTGVEDIVTVVNNMVANGEVVGVVFEKMEGFDGYDLVTFVGVARDEEYIAECVAGMVAL